MGARFKEEERKKKGEKKRTEEKKRAQARSNGRMQQEEKAVEHLLRGEGGVGLAVAHVHTALDVHVAVHTPLSENNTERTRECQYVAAKEPVLVRPFSISDVVLSLIHI